MIWFSQKSAQANDLIVFTENSATDLTVTLGGNNYGPVENVKNDEWNWTFPADPSVSDNAGLGNTSDWKEPDYSTTNNINWIGLTGSFTFVIFSDYYNIFGDNNLIDNGSIQNHVIVINNYDGSHASYDVQFIDNGDTSPVPEPTTILLLGTGLIGLTRFRRKFKK